MKVVSIDSVATNRSRISLDNGERFVLYKGEIRMLKIKNDTELPDEIYEQIMKGVLVKRSKLRAMNLLKARDYTEYQLRKKLLDAEYPDKIVDQAISYVMSYDYVNDKRYAVSYIKEQMERRSRKEIYQKLQLKGIKRETLDNAFSEVYDSDDVISDKRRFSETDVIIKALKKKHFTGMESYEEKQKLLAYFYRKGFDMDSVYKAMDVVRESYD